MDHQRIRRALAALVVLGLSASSPAVARLALDPPPEPKIMVVSANLRESHANWPDDVTGVARADLYYSAELTNFVDHLAEHVPAPPDVLLLQEVIAPSAHETAQLLTRKFDLPYQVVIAGDAYSNQIGPKGDDFKHKKNTAIIVNSDQIEVVGKVGYMTISAPVEEWSPYLFKVAQDQAHALLRDRLSGIEVAVMSIHWVTTPHFRSDSIANKRRLAWARQTRKFMTERFGDADVRVMGGEFSVLRCGIWNESRRCDHHPAYEVITRGPMKDSVLKASQHSVREYRRQVENRKDKLHRIDYIFASGEIHAASRSVDYLAQRYTPRYISDHKYDYVLVGP